MKTKKEGENHIQVSEAMRSLESQKGAMLVRLGRIGLYVMERKSWLRSEVRCGRDYIILVLR
jgi:hypothetical protein